MVLATVCQLGGLGHSAAGDSGGTHQAELVAIFKLRNGHATAKGAAVSNAPARPPAQICGNPKDLSGPVAAPPGAVVLNPFEDVPNLVAFTYGPNTTFWFSPGTYSLGNGPYSQIIPQSHDTFIGAPGAIIDGRHINDYAFTQTADDVTIEYLTITNFGRIGGNNNQGVVNSDAGTGWVIQHNTIQNNAGAGVALGTNDVVSDNCLTGNGQYGFTAYDKDGVRDITLTDNEISNNDTYNWEVADPGCGCAGGGKFWNVDDATVTGNYVHGNHDVGLWVDTDNAGFNISGNFISQNYSAGIIYETSYNALISNNTLVANANGIGPTNPGFPSGAIYISESGGDRRVPGPYAGSLSITGNVFLNNWSGVVLWENANRFCGSAANTSSGYCTLVNPSQANLSTCIRANLEGFGPGQSPIDYYDDCRWKTQNVSVTHNVFTFSPSAIGHDCTTAHGCGLQGLFSNFGTFPTWSPYQGVRIERAISSKQNNRFSDNTYNGPWEFMIYRQGQIAGFSTWRSTWGQDRGSTYNP